MFPAIPASTIPITSITSHPYDLKYWRIEYLQCRPCIEMTRKTIANTCQSRAWAPRPLNLFANLLTHLRKCGNNHRYVPFSRVARHNVGRWMNWLPTHNLMLLWYRYVLYDWTLSMKTWEWARCMNKTLTLIQSILSIIRCGLNFERYWKIHNSSRDVAELNHWTWFCRRHRLKPWI